MHKIDSPNATATNEFTDGDPGLGINATEVWSKILNTWQRELVAIVAAAGISLDDEDDTQVFQALMALFGVSLSGNAAAGSLVFAASGFKIQWATKAAPVEIDSNNTFTFPVAHTTWSVVLPWIQNTSGLDDDVHASVGTKSLTQVVVRAEKNASGLYTSSATRSIGYLSVGV